MATSGYGQTLTSAFWSDAFILAGATGVVATASAWKVSRVSGFRRVQIAAGTGFAAGIKEDRPGVSFLDLPQPRDPVTGQPSTTAGQWFLVVASYRRDGESGSVTFEAIPGATTARTPTPTVAPTAWPTLQRTSSVFQQPLAWSWVHPTDFSISRDLDLRRLPDGRPVQFADGKFSRTYTRGGTNRFNPGRFESMVSGTFIDAPAGSYKVSAQAMLSAEGISAGDVLPVVGTTGTGQFRNDLTPQVQPVMAQWLVDWPGGDLRVELQLKARSGIAATVEDGGTSLILTYDS